MSDTNTPPADTSAPNAPKVGLDDFLVKYGRDALVTLFERAETIECVDSSDHSDRSSPGVSPDRPPDGDPGGDPGNTPADTRPTVQVSPTEVHQTIDLVRQALAGVPGIYSRGTVLVEERAERLVPVPSDAMLEFLSRHIRFLVHNGDSFVRNPPPVNICRSVFARPIAPVREIRATANYPVMLADGRILDRAGYDPASGVLVHLSAGFEVAVPEHPTRQDAAAAAARLIDLFCDFPLVEDIDADFPAGKVRGCHSRAALVAFLLTVLARPAINGPTPFTLISKNTPGTGGTLLMETLGKILLGRDMPASTYPSGDHQEMRKLITSWCVEAVPLVNLDNLVGEIGDAELCRAITSTSWSDRILGANKTYTGAFTTVLIGSANNARLAADMPRRVVSVKMETDLARPEQRGNFKYDLNTHPLEHRSTILADSLTILRAWVLAGRPQATLPPYGKLRRGRRSSARRACSPAWPTRTRRHRTRRTTAPA